MADFQDVTRNANIPYDIPTTSGDLATPQNASDISRNGTYKPTNLLPGENPNIPSTYSVPSEGTKQAPYNTVDTTATPVPNGQIEGSQPFGSLPGTNNAGSLPSTTEPAGLLPGGAEIPGAGGSSAPASTAGGILSGLGNLLNNPIGSAINAGINGRNPVDAFNQSVQSGFKPTPELQQARDLEAKQNRDFLNGLANGIGDLAQKAWGALPNPFGNSKGNPNLRRKGNYNPSPNPPNGMHPLTGSRRVNYIVNFTYRINGGPPTPNGVYAQGPLGGIVQRSTGGNGISWDLVDGNGNHIGLIAGDASILQDKPVITSAIPQDGQPDPISPPNPVPRNPDGSPARVGTMGTPQNLNNPTVAPIPTAAQNTNPATGNANSPSVQPGQPTNQPKNPTPTIPFIPPLPIPGNPSSPTTSGTVPQLSPSPSTISSPLSTPTPSNPDATPVKAPEWNTTPGERTTPTTQTQTTPVTPNVNPGEGDKCCPQTQADLKDIKRVLGIEDFPSTLPLLTGDSDVVVNNIPELIVYNTRNIDAVIGEWPSSVTIEQPDTSTKEIKLQSVSHAIQELFAALIVTTQDVDGVLNVVARVATELVQTKIALLQNSDLTHAMQKFMGFQTTPVERTTKIQFSPSAEGADGKLEPDEISTFIKQSTQSYVGTDYSETVEVLPILQRILQDGEIARAALWHPIDGNNLQNGDITGDRINKANTTPTKVEQEQWTAYLALLKRLGIQVNDRSSNTEVKE